MWLCGAAFCAVLMYVNPGHETIPFHLIWLGLCLVYGFTTWRPVEMIIVVGLTAAITGAIMVHNALAGAMEWAETAEVPLSVALAAMIATYLQRRHAAVAELARLAASDRHRADLRQALVRQVSHELRTPITIARGYTEMIHNSADGQVRDDADIVLQELDNLAGITQRLLTVIQVDSPHDLRPVHLDGELQRIVGRWARATPRTWTVTAPTGTVIVNPDRLQAVVDCLLDNAVKFSNPHDRVRVDAAIGAHDWMVRITNTGTPLTEADAMALTAGQPLPRREGSGTGIGLVMARTVIEAWDGTLHFAPGDPAGAEVTVRVPAAAAQRTADPRPAHSPLS